MFGFKKKDKTPKKQEALQENKIPEQEQATQETPPVEEVPVDTRPILQRDEKGEIIIPVDKEGKPVLVIDDKGFAKVTLNEEGEPIIPTDENGNPYYAIDGNGRPLAVPPPPPPPEISIRVSPDNIKAYVRIKTFAQNQGVEVESVNAVLANSNIKYNLKTKEIAEFCEKKAFAEELLVSEGADPINGENGYIDYKYKIDGEINLREAEDGTVNYRELGLVQNVLKGEVLCTVVPPKDGTNGRNVFDEPILFKPGNPVEPRVGENAELSKDATQVIAMIDGCFEFKNNQITVTDMYTVKGNVNAGVGNLDCKGSILVQGDVHEGFIIKAKKDIIVKGTVEGAQLIAGGSITISNGMNGMNIGSLKAGANIVAKYIENSNLEAGADIYSDVIINSKCKAGDSIILKGGKASLIGGVSEAGQMIYGGFIGSHSNISTVVTIDGEEIRKQLTPAGTKVFDEMAIIKQDIQNEQEHLKRLDEQIVALAQKQDDAESKANLKAVNDDKAKGEAKIVEWQAKIEGMMEEANKLYKFKIIALKTAFTGVKMNIAYLYKNVEQDCDNTKFFVDGHTITAGQILPSDHLQ